jgi:ribosome maturation factor RimP
LVSTECIRELVEPVLASVGLELWDVEITRDVVRIMVERPSGPVDLDALPAPPRPDGGLRPGVDLDALSAASGALSPVLDTHPDAVPAGRYQLEVSSPGVERTLRTPEQFRRYVGSQITVKTSEPVAGARRHRGRLVDVDAAGIDMEPEEAPSERIPLRFDQMDRARTVMVWGPAAGRPKPGRPGSGQKVPSHGTAGRPAAARRTTTADNSKDPGS